MRTFITKLLIACAFGVLLHLGFAFFADGKTDAYYLRFTGDKKPSLVIGTSRAAQGFIPDRFNHCLEARSLSGPLFNFSFTSISSPFGEIYYHAITEKIDTTSGKGLFIVTVEPNAVGLRHSDKAGGSLPETTGQLASTHLYNQTPNFEYLIRNYHFGWGRLWLQHSGFFAGELELQSDGWLKVDVPMDSASVARRTKSKLKGFEQAQGKWGISSYRLEWMEKTIRFLQRHGEVFMVRLPISSIVLDYENKLMPEFDEAVRSIAANCHVPYNDMSGLGSHYAYKDGHHISKDSAIPFCDSVAHWIELQPKQ
jgi:hypothetical protein